MRIDKRSYMMFTNLAYSKFSYSSNSGNLERSEVTQKRFLKSKEGYRVIRFLKGNTEGYQTMAAENLKLAEENISIVLETWPQWE